MATLTLPFPTFVAGTPAYANQIQDNYIAIRDHINGQNIGTGNLEATLISRVGGPILFLNQASQEQIALSILNSRTKTALKVQQTGLLSAGSSAIHIDDDAAQTTGAAQLFLDLLATSTIPAILVNHGSAQTMSLTRTQLGFLGTALSLNTSQFSVLNSTLSLSTTQLNLFANALQMSGTAVTFFTNAFQASASQLLLFNSAIELSQERIKLPIRTTSERDAVTQEGSILYNTTSKVVQYRDDTEWKDFTPSGIIQMFAGTSAPSGWLYCNGQPISRTTYAKLFSVIGTTYGTGDGSTTFNLPNFVGIFPRGSEMDGVTTQTISTVSYTGQPLNTKQDDRFQEHTHYVHQRDNSNTHTEYPGFDGGGNGAMVWRSGLIGGGDQAVAGTLRSGRATTETRPANISIAYIIKA